MGGITKQELCEKRRKVTATIDAFIRTGDEKVSDSADVIREVIYTDENTIGALGYGSETSLVKVAANNFDVDLLLLKGAVKIEFEEGDSIELNEKKKHYFIPGTKSFIMRGIEADSVIFQRLEKVN